MSRSIQRPFYHSGTERKLDAVEQYLMKFLDVMTYQNGLQTVYIDAFAGTGAIPSDVDQSLFSGEFLEADDLAIGSAIRALSLKKKFSRYIFIDKSPSKIAELKSRVEALNLGDVQIDYIPGEANRALMELCPYLAKSNVRSVVFLDPFGNQVSWQLLKALADTRHVDLWYLFPAMLGVYRQIGNTHAKMTPEQEASLDELFGPHDWRSAFIAEDVERDFFGEHLRRSKIANVDAITRYKIECLKTIFRGCVLDEWLPLGRNNCHWYSLIFAMANPKPAAVKAGRAIAKHIMTRT